jgi:molybdopterin synthase catalytic subunit
VDILDVTPRPLQLASILESLTADSDDACGAELVFSGVVRSRNHGKKVVAVSYDAFEPLALATFKEICDEARTRWGQTLRIALVHRTGRLEAGETSVIIAVASPHRAEAYEASRYVIENLKTRAPIWKKETYEDGESDWLQGHALCQHSVNP